MAIERFWLVWNEAHRAPMFKHPSEDLAKKEAERLALLHQGQVFHVLGLVGSCTKKGAEWLEIQDKIPF